MAERHITMVRHGHYTRNSELLGGGDLTSTGVEQAQRLADALYDQYPITALYSSTLRRAMSTAHIVATRREKIGFNQDENLCEALFYVSPANRELYANISEESITAQRIRVAFAYDTYMVPATEDTDEHDVIVAHGNLIRYFTVRAMNAPIQLWHNLEIYHTGINRFIVSEDASVQMVTHNEIAHLPRRLWTLS